MYRNRQRKLVRYAFTMIELIVVMLILAIAAAVVVPMASSAGSMQLRAAGNMVAADLEYAKSMAISRGVSYAVVFNAATETYQIEDLSKAVSDPQRVIDHPVKKGFKYVVDFRRDGRLDRVDIVSANFNGTNQVAFDYLGSPFDGSSNPLNSGVVTLQASSATRMVRVEPVTGYITVSD